MALSSSCPQPTCERAGVTLVELLIVLAILAVLAGLLLPTIGWVRTRARQTACSSNLAQLGAATKVYAEQEGGRLPASQNWGATKPERSSAWFNQLPRMMSEQKINRPGTIFQCPSFDGAAPGLIRNEVAKSYKMNVELDRVRQGTRGYRYQAFFIDRISDADQVVLFIDGITTGGKGQWGYGGAKEVDDSRHLGWVAVVFTDLHTTQIQRTPSNHDWSTTLRWTSQDW
jgi:prepilin-type N-terminal cleavage/methylation domain-containing protein